MPTNKKKPGREPVQVTKNIIKHVGNFAKSEEGRALCSNTTDNNRRAQFILEMHKGQYVKLTALIPALHKDYKKNVSAYGKKITNVIKHFKEAADESDPSYVPPPYTIPTAPRATTSNSTAAVHVPPPTPGASTAAEMIPSTPVAAPSTPEWKSALDGVAKGLDTITKMAVEREEREAKREAKREDRDAKREAKRDEEFDKLASATKIAMETGTLALTTANQANQKGDFVIKEIEKTNKKVDRLEKFEKFVMEGGGKQLFRREDGDMSDGK